MADPKTEAKTINVLELCCENGLARIPITLRYKKNKVHYVGIGAGPDINFKSVDDFKYFRKEDLKDVKNRLVEEFHSLRLNFENSKRLKKQLKEIVGDKKFDEIHFHMGPVSTDTLTFKQEVNLGYESSFKIRQKKAKESLKVIGAFLKPGGRFYHIFQMDSPLLCFDEKIANNVEEIPEAFEENKKKIEGIVNKSGLILDKYAGRPYEGRLKDYPHHNYPRFVHLLIKEILEDNPTESGIRKEWEEWITKPNRSSHYVDRTLEVYSGLVQKYSEYGQRWGTGFVILRKPNKKK